MPRDTLETTLEGLRDELRSAVRFRLAAIAAAVIAGAFWGALLIDRWLEPPPGARAVAWGVAALFSAGWAAAYAAPRLFAKPSDRQLAGLLARRRPEAADAALTAVELRGAESPLAEATRQEAERALHAAGDIRVTRPRSEVAPAWFAAVGLAAILLTVAVSPDQMRRYLDRLALSPEPWPRRVLLIAEGFEPDGASGRLRRSAVLGEPCELTVWADLSEGHVAPESVWSRWRTVGGRWGRGVALARVGAPRERRQAFRLRLPEVVSDTELIVRGGDCRLPRLLLRATPRPKVVGVSLVCQPPAYLGEEGFVTPASAARALPIGSEVSLRIDTSKPISAAWADFQTQGSESWERVDAIPSDSPQGFALRQPSLEGPTRVRLEVKDADGLGLETPFELEIQTLPDDPPTVEIKPHGVGRAVTRDALLRVVVAVNDDHGVDRVAVRLSTPAERGVDETRSFYADFPARLPARREVSVDLLALRSAESRLEVAPGARLTLQAEASDRYDLAPRDPSLSEALVFDVVTPQELLALLSQSEAEMRQSLEAQLTDVQRLRHTIELRRRREAASDETGGRSAWLDDGRLQSQKTGRGVAAVAAAARRLAEEAENNRLDQPALVRRLREGVAEPLDGEAAERLGRLADRFERAGPEGDLQPLEAEAAAASATIKAVLAKLEARQTYNEVVARLRGLLRDQRRVNDQTQSQKRDEARRLLLE